MSASFGAPDPGVALSTPPSLLPKPGPLHQVEFVIELVGPNSVPAAAADALLKPEWQAPLGQPRVWAMTPQDTMWQPLTPRTDGSYDSLVLCWPYLGAAGHLTSRSAITLAGAAERFASGIHRRALTLPPPNDVDAAVRSIKDVAERLDIGVSVSVEFEEPIAEEPIWRTAIELGLSLNGLGEFVWGDPAQVTLVPLAEPMQFTLGSVRSGRRHEGITVGFSAPQVVMPLESLRAAFHVADAYARKFRGLVFGDGGDPMTPSLRAEYERNLEAAVKAFAQVGLISGSAETVRLFGG
ncbi:MAG: hypothetical protein ACYC96_02430 [Fimbriimonadaceae bacterium]